MATIIPPILAKPVAIPAQIPDEIVPNFDSEQFINVPIKNIQGEYMVVRPSSIMAIRVEPVFFGSVERV